MLTHWPGHFYLARVPGIFQPFWRTKNHRCSFFLFDLYGLLDEEYWLKYSMLLVNFRSLSFSSNHFHTYTHLTLISRGRQTLEWHKATQATQMFRLRFYTILGNLSAPNSDRWASLSSTYFSSTVEFNLSVDINDLTEWQAVHAFYIFVLVPYQHRTSNMF